MTEFKIYRISAAGAATVEVVVADNWLDVISKFIFEGTPVFKIEISGSRRLVDVETFNGGQFCAGPGH